MAEPAKDYRQSATPGSVAGSAETASPHAPRTSASQQSGLSGGDRASESRGKNADGQNVMQQVRSTAADALQTAKTNTAAKIEEQKSTLSRGLSNVAENVRHLGDGLSGSNQNDPVSRFAADYSGMAADKLDGVADYFNSHDLNAIYRDTESFARRNPAVIIGGALALGFLAARFFKSSSERYSSYEPGSRRIAPDRWPQTRSSM